MLKFLTLATTVAAYYIKAPAGDPECAFGIRSDFKGPDAVSVCCPKYCGECSDYAGCEKVNEQDSENACCATKVQKLTCDNNSEDPYCIRSCKEKSAPCSLGVVEEIPIKPETTASADCGNAVGDFEKGCKTAVKSIQPEQWDDLQARSVAAGDAAKKAHNQYKN